VTTWTMEEAAGNLTELARLITQLDDLLEPGPHTRLPRYLTTEMRRAEADLIRQERHEREVTAQAGLPAGIRSRAPVVISAASALATVHGGLCRLEALVFDRLAVVPWPPDYPADTDRCERIGERLTLLEDPFASWLANQVGRLVAVATAAADEDRQILMGRPCPICGREDTLVVYIDRDYVRCNAEAGCVCSVPDCRCRKVAGWRHVWDRPQWGLLARGIASRAARDRAAEAARVEVTETVAA